MRVTEILSEMVGVKSQLAQIPADASHDDWASMLAKHGFKPIGQGLHGQVYVHPSLNYVLKVFTSDDRSYQYWLKVCQGPLKGNPYVPAFRGKSAKLNAEATAVRLEKLAPGTPQQMDLARQLQRVLLTASREKRDWREDPLIKQLDDQLWQVVAYIQYGFEKYGFMLDLKGSNVMSRNGQMVVIDPLA
jgi:hypothetical protein